MKGIFQKGSLMGMENLLGVMEEFTKVNISMVENRVMANILMVMGKYMLDNGNKVSSMVKDTLFMQMVQNSSENGWQGKK